MLVLDALFDHIQQISSNGEIMGNLVQRTPVPARDVRVTPEGRFRKQALPKASQNVLCRLIG